MDLQKTPPLDFWFLWPGLLSFGQGFSKLVVKFQARLSRIIKIFSRGVCYLGLKSSIFKSSGWMTMSRILLLNLLVGKFTACFLSLSVVSADIRSSFSTLSLHCLFWARFAKRFYHERQKNSSKRTKGLIEVHSTLSRNQMNIKKTWEILSQH